MGEKASTGAKGRKTVKRLQQATVTPLNLEALLSAGSAAAAASTGDGTGAFYSTPSGLSGAARRVNVSKLICLCISMLLILIWFKLYKMRH